MHHNIHQMGNDGIHRMGIAGQSDSHMQYRWDVVECRSVGGVVNEWSDKQEQVIFPEIHILKFVEYIDVRRQGVFQLCCAFVANVE